MRRCTAAVCNYRRTWCEAKRGQQPLQEANRPLLVLLLLWLLHLLLLLTAACTAEALAA
jgi:hypothetical protein